MPSKLTSRLIANLRSLFGFLRGLMAISFILTPLISLIPSGKTPRSLGTVYLSAPAVSVTPATDSTARTGYLRHVRGELRVQQDHTIYRPLERITDHVPYMIQAAFSFTIFHLLWRLCRNVENGEVFTVPNLKFVRYIGVALITYTFVFFGVSFWANARVLAYTREHVSVAGLQIAGAEPSAIFTGIDPTGVSFDISQLVTGLLVLALAEVFRRGLELQEEAALTV